MKKLFRKILCRLGIHEWIVVREDKRIGWIFIDKKVYYISNDFNAANHPKDKACIHCKKIQYNIAKMYNKLNKQKIEKRKKYIKDKEKRDFAKIIYYGE